MHSVTHVCGAIVYLAVGFLTLCATAQTVYMLERFISSQQQIKQQGKVTED